MSDKGCTYLSLAHPCITAQCAVFAVCFPTERAETYFKIYVLIFNIYLTQLVRLEGKLDLQGNHEFQTLNLGFPGHFNRF